MLDDHDHFVKVPLPPVIEITRNDGDVVRIADLHLVERRHYEERKRTRRAAQLDAEVRAYSQADSERVTKSDLASFSDEPPAKKCRFIDDEAVEVSDDDEDIILEKDEFVVLDDDDCA